jgi:hypothetical protein
MMKLNLANSTISTSPFNGRMPAHQRNGAFELYVGLGDDVDARLTERKQVKSAYGQLSLTSNVVESDTNLSYLTSENPVINQLSPYLDYSNTTRNGQFGQQASFVYPLKMPTQKTVASNNMPQNTPELKVGIYADDQDLKNFLNYVGVDEWKHVVNDSPDKVTQYALAYAEDVSKDAQGNPIQLHEVSSKTTTPAQIPQRFNRLA